MTKTQMLLAAMAIATAAGAAQAQSCTLTELQFNYTVCDSAFSDWYASSAVRGWCYLVTSSCVLF